MRVASGSSNSLVTVAVSCSDKLSYPYSIGTNSSTIEEFFMAGGELEKSEERSGDAEEYSGQWSM